MSQRSISHQPGHDLSGSPQGSLAERVIERAIEVQQIPSPPFGEEQRAAFVCQQFQLEGLADIEIDAVGNAYGRLAGTGDARPLVFSAHLDTVFPEGSNLHSRREAQRVYGPGIGDNSLGVAGLFGLLWALRQRRTRLSGDVWLVANVGEEGLGNLRGMKAVVERFRDRPQAYIVLEGMAFGQVYHRALGVQRYRISVHTAGGHSWVDYGRPSAVHELAALATRLAALPVPSSPRSSLNVGILSGGTGVNTIASDAYLELDLRSEGEQSLCNLTEWVDVICRDAGHPGVQVQVEQIGQRPAGSIASSHPLVQLARRCVLAQGVEPIMTVGSTDANIPLSLGLPAICLGISTGAGAHTLGEYIYTAPVAQGIAHLQALVEGMFIE